MVAVEGHAVFDPTATLYVSTLVHELFHRWQKTNFSGPIGGQDIEGYAYTAQNLELADLEDLALLSALAAETRDELEQAARRFAALRIARLAADSRVVLDTDQERTEGTARWLEHALAGDDIDYGFYNTSNFAEAFTPEISVERGGLKGYYGFLRFYATGATIVHLLNRLGSSEIEATIEGGASPAEALIAYLDVTPDQVDDLVAEARASYDPQGELAATAAAAAEQIQGEPALFGEPFAPTNEEITCFADRGIDIMDGTKPPTPTSPPASPIFPDLP